MDRRVERRVERRVVLLVVLLTLFGALAGCAAQGGPPRIVRSTPADGATEVATGAQLVLTFSTAMDPATVAVVPDPMLDLGEAAWNDARTVVYGPPSGWRAATDYVLSVTGADRDGNALAAGTTLTFTTAAGADVTAPATPTDVTATPADHAFTLTWDANGEADLAGYRVFFGENPAELSDTRFVAAPEASLTITGLDNGTTYHYAVAAEDQSGNRSDPSPTGSVTPADDVAPTLLSSEPADGATDLTLVPAFRFTFSEAMDRGSVEIGACVTDVPPASATCAAPSLLALGSPTWSEGDTVVSFPPPTTLQTGKTTVLALAATDLAGNALGGRNQVAFALRATPDTEPPTVLSHDGDLTDDVPRASVTFTFSEAMDQASVEGAFLSQPSIDCSWTWSGATATCTAGGYLQQLTDYQVAIGTAAMDTAGNAMQAPYTFDFTTTNFAPRLLSVSPRDGAFNVSSTASITFTFSEPMRAESFDDGLSVMKGSAAVPGALSWNAQGDVGTFSPTTGYGNGASVRWTLSTDVQERGNGRQILLHLPAEVTGSFMTRLVISRGETAR